MKIIMLALTNSKRDSPKVIKFSILLPSSYSLGNQMISTYTFNPSAQTRTSRMFFLPKLYLGQDIGKQNNATFGLLEST